MCPLSPPGELHREDDLDQSIGTASSQSMYRQALFKEHAGQTKAGGLTVRIFVYEQAPARLLKIRL